MCQLFVTIKKGGTPRGIVNLLSLLALVAIDDSETCTTDGVIHHHHMGVLGQSSEGGFQLGRILHLVDVAHGQARPGLSLFTTMSQTLEGDRHREGIHQFLLDMLIGCLFTHSMHRFTVLAGSLTQYVIILGKAQDFLHRHQFAGIGSRTGKNG